ncbi:MAG: pyridoxamine 5'-phosphate oxidase family protein [Chloroflexi bacterium]|nr:pyridoxamine 5'-phosphate oxidase family protein [Chloroflexota bacterium]
MRELSMDDIEALISGSKIARLGIYDRHHQRVYIVPVSYYFRDGAAYLHSAPGLKLDLLHEQPRRVCFQVDQISDEGEWQSALGWGNFEQITDPDQRMKVLQGFGDRLQRGPLRERSRFGRAGMVAAGETVYRIVFEQLTGRADSSGWSAAESD